MRAITTVVIDLYDCGILISDGDQVLANSASCAFIESDSSIIIGELAEQQAHLRPREICTQFWGQLSTSSSTKHVVSNAELAYKHLKCVWEQLAKQDYEVILATPSSLTKQDLGLLLGICEKLSISVLGLVSKAALALHGPVTKSNSKIVYLDVLQQRILITEILQTESSISALQPTSVLKHGLQSLTNNLAKFIAEKFIAETRFDPMHIAEDEQQFFDKLALWLKMLETSDATECKLTSNTSHHRIQLHKEHLININQLAFNEIANSLEPFSRDQSSIVVICSPICAQVFGLLDFLKTLPGCAILLLEQNSIAKQAILYKDQINSNDKHIHYTTSLKWNQSAQPLTLKFNPESLSKLNTIPTHVLLNNQAYPLAQEIFVTKNKNSKRLTINSIYSDNAICKITTNGLLVEIENLNNCAIKFNGEVLSTRSFVQIGDHLYIDENNNDLHFIKLNYHET